MFFLITTRPRGFSSQAESMQRRPPTYPVFAIPTTRPDSRDTIGEPE